MPARRCVRQVQSLQKLTRKPDTNGAPIAQVTHPVALNRHVRILQQVLRVDRPEEAFAGPQHDGYDVHAHLVDQTCGQHLATDVASSDLDDAVPASSCALATAASMPLTK